MIFYISSYKLGDSHLLKELFLDKRIAYIPNALDHATDAARKKKHIKNDIDSLKAIKIKVELLDLRDYFGKKDDLRKKLSDLQGLWVSGGNTFVLRQAMALSGLDDILKHELVKRKDFIYGGYSAAGCVLAPSLKPYQIVDDPTQAPYNESKETIWKGLGLVKWAFMPHYHSMHPESKDIEREIEYCKKNKIPYKVLADGEILVF